MASLPDGQLMPVEQLAMGCGSALGREVWSLPAMLQARAEASGDAPALWSLTGADGTWRAMSWREYRDDVARVVRGLRTLGLAAGERVGIMAPSCPRWDLLQMGILACGGVVVGMDANDLDANLDDVARRCRLTGLIVLDPSWERRFGSEAREGLRFVVHLGAGGSSERGISFDELARLGGSKPDHDWQSARADDPATILFTSGTTGAPKGIQYTHRQVCLAVASILAASPGIDHQTRLACWLPLSNMFQRIINALAIACGAQTYYVEDPREIMRHVGTIAPHVFIGVPRFYEKLHAGMMERVAAGPSWQRTLVHWALRAGDSRARALRDGLPRNALQRAYDGVADRLVLGRLRAVMGPNLRYLVSGSAPMPGWLLERFHAMGLLVLEAYGLSENVIPVAMNRFDAYRFGTVGRPLSGSEVRLAQDGELMVRGPGVIAAYYGEGQAGLLDGDGYLATGDYAAIDTDGFITLTGRKSEIIKTATGRRIAPAGIENVLLQAPAVQQVAVFGANRPFLIAVVVVSASTEGSRLAGDKEHPALRAACDRLRRELAGFLEPLPTFKRPAGLVVTTRPFSVGSGELTTNLKLRRGNIAMRYATEIDALYQRLEQAGGGSVLEAVAGREQDTALCSL